MDPRMMQQGMPPQGPPQGGPPQVGGGVPPQVLLALTAALAAKRKPKKHGKRK